MALATGAGAILPGLPFVFLSSAPALVAVAVLSVVLGWGIGRARDKGVHGYLETFAILAAVTVITIVAGLALGGAG